MIKHFWFKKEYPHETYEVDLKEWGRLFGEGERVVAKTTIGLIEVSTVFLGLSSGMGDSLDQMFETMLFGYTGDNEYQWRYETYVEAAQHHVSIVMHLMTGGRLEDIDGLA